jgi:hypothetical protein
MEKMTTKIKNTVSSYFVPAFILACMGVLIWDGITTKREALQASLARKEVICPALLSISRSARDTLIVMKAEDLCKDFVLDNLK